MRLRLSLAACLVWAAALAPTASAQQPIPLADPAAVAKSLDAMRAELAATEKKLAEAAGVAEEARDKADTAWLLVSSALVYFMVPGLALFYGGMVRRKNVLATMMQSMACTAVVGLYWLFVGYSLAFGPSVCSISPGNPLSFLGTGGVLGWSWDLVFLKGIDTTAKLPGANVPVYAHAMFQGMFAIITPALISGAVAERIRFWPFCIFSVLWVTFVYCPLAHMVWACDWFAAAPVDAAKGLGGSPIGLLGRMEALDFAGGTVVHVAAGAAGLAACLVLRRREGYRQTAIHPNSMVLTLLGAGMLWFGWFGFNGGSATASGTLATSAFAATQAAAAAAGLGWIVIEWLMKGKPTALGLASGIVAGLVAVTPASGYVAAWAGAAIGLVASLVCYAAVALKNRLGYDDSLDAFGIHGVGGFVGAVLTGVFCSTLVNPAGFDGPLAVSAQKARLEALPRLTADAERGGHSADAAKLKGEQERIEKAVAQRGEAGRTGFTQVRIQLYAACIAALGAFAVSAALVALTQAMTGKNFRTDHQGETDGLDRTEHGEVGFDFGYASESASFAHREPRAASSPKAGTQRFDLTVEGVPADDIAQLWTALCQPGEKAPSAEFLAVYPHVTTFAGNRFRCRGGDAPAVTNRLEALFKKLLPGRAIKVTRI